MDFQGGGIIPIHHHYVFQKPLSKMSTPKKALPCPRPQPHFLSTRNGRHSCPDLPMKYARRIAKRRAAAMADRAAHFQLQYLEGFFSLKAFLEKVFLGSRRGGGV